jgi:hypothetical protein
VTELKPLSSITVLRFSYKGLGILIVTFSCSFFIYTPVALLKECARGYPILSSVLIPSPVFLDHLGMKKGVTTQAGKFPELSNAVISHLPACVWVY